MRCSLTVVPRLLLGTWGQAGLDRLLVWGAVGWR